MMEVDQAAARRSPSPDSGVTPTSGSIDGRTSSSSLSTSAALSPSGALTFPESAELPVESEGSFRWEVKSFSQLGDGKILSPAFRVGSHTWNVLLYPRGNEPYVGQSLSLYVAIDTAEAASSGDRDWAVCAQLILTVQNTRRPETALNKYTQHRFNAAEIDWGFSQFCPLKALTAGDESTDSLPLLDEDDTLTIAIRLRIIRDDTGVLWHNFINYDSKKITGFVGLANQGATCYMNSLLQSLYFTNTFRKAVYQIPTGGDVPHESSALALQRVFWKLQHGSAPVSTQELTRAFGWNTMESFVQSDVQEFGRVLMDEFEKRMKGTAAEGTIERLFTGKVRNVIKCLDVQFASTRTESFYDLQLAIKGVSTLEESFDNYVRAEMLEGDNKYHAEGFGLQDAKRYVEFESFPPVLHLHLERYAFDPRVMATVKINDRLEFPLRINLEKYLAADSPQRGQPQDFILQSVFVHSGDSHGGHYYVFIRNPLEGDGARWYRFDDTKVIPATRKEAVEDNFGGPGDEAEERTGNVMTRLMSIRASREHKYRRFTNAYMLVYIRESDLATILQPIAEPDIPPHISESIRREEETERVRREEKQRQQMMVKARIITERHVADHGGYDLFNLDNRNLALTEHVTHVVRRDETLGKLRETVAQEDLQIAAERVRFWTLAPRRNKTIRLDEPLSEEELSKPVGHVYHRSASLSAPFILYAQVLPETPSPCPLPAKDDLCIYFKFYDPEQSKLKPIGMLSLRANDTLDSVQGRLLEIVGLPKNVALEYFEEIKPGRIDSVPSNKPLAACQLQTGDIICFQIAQPILSDAVAMPKVTDYFAGLQAQLHVTFQYMDGGELMSRRVNAARPYLELLTSVGEKLGAPASHIRLHLLDEASTSTPLKANGKHSLTDVLRSVVLPANCAMEGITVACEVTTVPAAELEEMKLIHVQAVPNEALECDAYVAPTDTLDSMYARLPEALRAAVQPPLRLLEVHGHRIIRDYYGDDMLLPLTEDSSVLLEGFVDAAESNLAPGCHLISVMSHLPREPSRHHSRPLRLLLLPDEPFSITKGRLLAKLNATPEEAEKWTFSVVSYGRARPIADDEVLASSGLSGHDQLGVGRPDPKGTASAAARMTPLSASIERSITIRSSSKQQQ